MTAPGTRCAAGLAALLATLSSSPARGAVPAAPDDDLAVIRELEARVARDPEDYIALNKLAERYLTRLRQTGDVTFVNLALQAAGKSVAICPPRFNRLGLVLAGRARHAAHQFDEALKVGQAILKNEPASPDGLCLTGDAFLELGRYEEAAAAYALLEGDGADPTVECHTRLARLAFLKGDTAAAGKHLRTALAVALDATPVSHETVAWCKWQVGELMFAMGQYEPAASWHRQALQDIPGYFRASAGLGRALAALGHTDEAIASLKAAVRAVPDPTFLAALSDACTAAGRDGEANDQEQVIASIRKLNQAGTLFDRVIALHMADRNAAPLEAFQLASAEFAIRPDVYSADALAWTALKAGKIPEASRAARDALRLGTQDPRILYHAGMIELAAGDGAGGSRHLALALSLSPNFDPIQAPLARAALSKSAAASRP